MLREAKLEPFFSGTDLFSRSLKALISFVLYASIGPEVGAPVFDRLKCLTLREVESAHAIFSIVSRCHRLQRLTLIFCPSVDFTFLRATPQLKCLANISFQRFCAKDAQVISQEAPNLHSLSFHLTDFSVCNFNSVGRQLHTVTHLMVLGKIFDLKKFLARFCEYPSMFPRVVSLRLFVWDPRDTEDIEIKHNARPHCTISQVRWPEEYRGRLCGVCGQRRTYAQWMCRRCQC